jgi:hypothetical protein
LVVIERIIDIQNKKNIGFFSIIKIFLIKKKFLKKIKNARIKIDKDISKDMLEKKCITVAKI